MVATTRCASAKTHSCKLHDAEFVVNASCCILSGLHAGIICLCSSSGVTLLLAHDDQGLDKSRTTICKSRDSISSDTASGADISHVNVRAYRPGSQSTSSLRSVRCMYTSKNTSKLGFSTASLDHGSSKAPESHGLLEAEDSSANASWRVIK